jgi:hypothetical protein
MAPLKTIYPMELEPLLLSHKDFMENLSRGNLMELERSGIRIIRLRVSTKRDRGYQGCCKDRKLRILVVSRKISTMAKASLLSSKELYTRESLSKESSMELEICRFTMETHTKDLSKMVSIMDMENSFGLTAANSLDSITKEIELDLAD